MGRRLYKSIEQRAALRLRGRLDDMETMLRNIFGRMTSDQMAKWNTLLADLTAQSRVCDPEDKSIPNLALVASVAGYGMGLIGCQSAELATETHRKQDGETEGEHA